MPPSARLDGSPEKQCLMLTLRKNVVNLFVDRASRQWIVLDPDGNFWIVSTDHANPWEQRQPFYPNDQTELEPVPGHYGSACRPETPPNISMFILGDVDGI